MKIEEQKRLREEILKQKELRRQLQAGARKRELLERLAQQQGSSGQQQEEETSQLSTNGSPLLPLPGVPPRPNVKYRLMVKKQDPILPNPPVVQAKPPNTLQAEDNTPFQGQQIKTVKQLRQPRTLPENELLQLSHRSLQTKPALAHLNPSQIARVASIQGQPQELKPGVKRTVMQRANSGSGDGPHVGTKVRVIKLSGGVSYPACLSFVSLWFACCGLSLSCWSHWQNPKGPHVDKSKASNIGISPVNFSFVNVAMAQLCLDKGTYSPFVWFLYLGICIFPVA